MDQLSENFTLSEFTKSSTAIRRDIANIPGQKAIAAMRLLCANILEPIRRNFARPLLIHSGFRSPILNRLVGSNVTSQHLLGEAADIEIPGAANGTLAAWIRDNLQFDQLILEAYTPGEPSSGWVHVSYRAANLRFNVLTATPRSGKMAYSTGLKL